MTYLFAARNDNSTLKYHALIKGWFVNKQGYHVIGGIFKNMAVIEQNNI